MADQSLDPEKALRDSHERLRQVVKQLEADDYTRPAYPTEWSVAQVMSHLGSGAEIFNLLLQTALNGQDEPAQDAYVGIWDRWNAKSPAEQVADGISTDTSLVEQLERLSADTRQRLAIPAFGSVLTLTDFVAMRLAEHALHTWDIEVTFEPQAQLGQEQVPLLLGRLQSVAVRSGVPQSASSRLDIQVTDPSSRFRLTIGPVIDLASAPDSAASADASLPAEAFIRLLYGRLDEAHTPELANASHEVVSRLRAVFRGY